MQTTISLSIHALTQSLLAESALRHHLDQNRPPLLTPDHNPALTLVVRNAFHRLSLELHPFIADCTAPSDSDLMQLTLVVPDSATDSVPNSLRGLLERALESVVLEEIYTGIDSDVSQAYGDRCRLSIGLCRRMLGSSPYSSLRPNWL